MKPNILLTSFTVVTCLAFAAGPGWPAPTHPGASTTSGPREKAPELEGHSDQLGPRPGDFHSPLVELCRCVKTNPFWVSYRLLTGFLKPTAMARRAVIGCRIGVRRGSHARRR